MLMPYQHLRGPAAMDLIYVHNEDMHLTFFVQVYLQASNSPGFRITPLFFCPFILIITGLLNCKCFVYFIISTGSCCSNQSQQIKPCSLCWLTVKYPTIKEVIF